MAEQTRQETIKKVADLIKDIPVAVVTTEDEQGRLHSRPMASVNAAFDGYLWFFTRGHTRKTREVEHHRQVNVSFADMEHGRYISTCGPAYVEQDQSKMQNLWADRLTTWFPHGLSEPDLVLLRVDVEDAEYWDAASGSMVHLGGLEADRLAGTPYPAPQAESAKDTGKHAGR